MVLALLGLHTNPIFSLGNGIIVAFGLYNAMKSYKEKKGFDFDYQKGFIYGLFIGFKATLYFTLFFAIFVTHIQPDFLPQMLMNWSSHYHVGVGTVVFIAAIMGFATTFMLTLSFMQLLKNSWNSKKYQLHS